MEFSQLGNNLCATSEEWFSGCIRDISEGRALVGGLKITISALFALITFPFSIPAALYVHKRLSERDIEIITTALPEEKMPIAAKGNSSAVSADISVQTRQAFDDSVQHLSEEGVVAYVKSHRLDFIKPGEAIKIKKNPAAGRQESLVILSDQDRNKVVFRTGKKAGKSVPGGANAIRLGQGAFKTVFKALNLITGEFVAIGQASKKSQESIEREYRVTQQVNSPHVLKVQNYGIREEADVDKVYTVSKLCQYTLSEKLAEDRNYLRNHPDLLEQIEQGYKDCHRKGVAQNDNYNGQNTFISEEKKLFGLTTERKAFLADFGNAREIAQSEIIDVDTPPQEMTWQQKDWLREDHRNLNRFRGVGFSYL